MACTCTNCVYGEYKSREEYHLTGNHSGDTAVIICCVTSKAILRKLIHQ